MREVTLYIGMSLDGYIADRDGGVGWMDAAAQSDAPAEAMPSSYDALLRRVDTVVLGGVTYRQIREQLAPGAWPYAGLQSYVCTRRPGPAPAEPGVTLTAEDPCALVRRLRGQPGRGIWVCGGASVAQQLAAAGLIDRYELALLPVLLGGGVRLFGGDAAPQGLRLLHCRRAGPLAELTYAKA